MIAEILQYLYPDLVPDVNWALRDDGDGPYIARWNADVPKPTRDKLVTIMTDPEFVAWKNMQAGYRIDRDTGKAINEGVHPFAGVEEQLAILREQLGEILNAVGLAPTADFDRLNMIATEKIQAAQKKKEALKNA